MYYAEALLYAAVALALAGAVLAVAQNVKKGALKRVASRVAHPFGH
jgi:hypothetical protein